MDRERSVGKKVSRIERQKDIRVRGSGFDPRRGRDKINKYNSNQLNSYMNELNSFQSRGTRFERGAYGAPIPRGDAERYRSAERRFNRASEQRIAGMRDVQSPQTDMTISQRVRMFSRNRQPGMKDMTVTTPFEGINRDISKVASADSIRRFTRNLESRMTKTDYNMRIRNQRRGAIKMANDAQMPDFAKRLRGLTNEQFTALYTGTDVMGMLAERYPQSSDAEGGPEFVGDDAVMDEMHGLVGWSRSTFPRG